MPGEVVGRGGELERIEKWLRGPDTPVLLLKGEAGIGKTTLWRAAVERAREQGMRVVASVASEAESRLSYSGLGDVVGPIADDILDDLPPPQRRALAAALLLQDADDRPPDEGAVAVATLAALRAAGTLTLFAIDDAQWLDRSSSGALAYALRRLGTSALPECSSRGAPALRRARARKRSPAPLDGPARASGRYTGSSRNSSARHSRARRSRACTRPREGIRSMRSSSHAPSCRPITP